MLTHGLLFCTANLLVIIDLICGRQLTVTFNRFFYRKHGRHRIVARQHDCMRTDGRREQVSCGAGKRAVP